MKNVGLNPNQAGLFSQSTGRVWNLPTELIEKTAISNVIFVIELLNKINIFGSHFEEKYWNFKL